jgi:hypothetical protein
MSKASALALANHLANTRPREDQSFDEYMRDALARWPDLNELEIEWAIARAQDICRGEAAQMSEEADALEATERRQK